MNVSRVCPFLKASARGVVTLGKHCSRLPFWMSSLNASRAYCLVTSALWSRNHTISSCPFAAAAAKGVRPEKVSLAVPETPFARRSFTIWSWPFIMAWIRRE